MMLSLFVLVSCVHALPILEARQVLASNGLSTEKLSLSSAAFGTARSSSVSTQVDRTQPELTDRTDALYSDLAPRVEKDESAEQFPTFTPAPVKNTITSDLSVKNNSDFPDFAPSPVKFSKKDQVCHSIYNTSTRRRSDDLSDMSPKTLRRRAQTSAISAATPPPKQAGGGTIRKGLAKLNPFRKTKNAKAPNASTGRVKAVAASSSSGLVASAKQGTIAAPKASVSKAASSISPPSNDSGISIPTPGPPISPASNGLDTTSLAPAVSSDTASATLSSLVPNGASTDSNLISSPATTPPGLSSDQTSISPASDAQSVSASPPLASTSANASTSIVSSDQVATAISPVSTDTSSMTQTGTEVPALLKDEIVTPTDIPVTQTAPTQPTSMPPPVTSDMPPPSNVTAPANETLPGAAESSIMVDAVVLPSISKTSAAVPGVQVKVAAPDSSLTPQVAS